MIAEYIWSLVPSEISRRFIGDLPTLSDEGVALIMDEGGVPTTFFSSGARSSIKRPIARFIARSKEYVQGEEWCNTIHKVLDRYTDDRIMSSIQIGSVAYLGKTDLDLHEHQVQFNLLIFEEE